MFLIGLTPIQCNYKLLILYKIVQATLIYKQKKERAGGISQVVQSMVAAGRSTHLTSTNNHASPFYGHYATSLGKLFQLDPRDAIQLQPESQTNEWM